MLFPLPASKDSSVFLWPLHIHTTSLFLFLSPGWIFGCKAMERVDAQMDG